MKMFKYKKRGIVFILLFIPLYNYSVVLRKWKGTTNSNWNTASNWDGGTLPTSASNPVITIDPANYTGAAANPVISSNSLFTIWNLFVNNGATLTIQANATVTGDILSVDAGATINMSGGTLTVTSPPTFDVYGVFNQSEGTINADYLFVHAGAALNQSGGTINMDGGIGALLQVDGTFNGTAGVVNIFNGTTSLYSNGTFKFFNLTIAATGTLDYGIGETSAISIAGNWTNSGSFNESTNTVTFNGSGTQTIINSSGETFYNLTTNTTGPLTFAAATDVTITNTLTMTSGLYNLNERTLTLGNSAASALVRSSSSTTNWVYGGTFKRYWLASTAVTSTSGNYYGLFPMGTSDASSYRPVEINTTVSPTGGGYFTVNHVSSPGILNLSPVYNDAGTNITRIGTDQFITAISGVTGGTYNIDVTMTGLPAGNVNDIRLAVFAGGTTASAVGTHAASTGTAQNPTAKRSGITTLTNFNNDFRIATTDSVATPLPIKLLSFTAKSNDNSRSILTEWTTASEINNNYFTVYRSKDAIDWENAGTVKGSGTTSKTKSYSLSDAYPYSGTSYYKLRQTDYDGKWKESNPVAVNLSDESSPIITIYPNPFNNNVNCSISSSGNQGILIKLLNASASEVLSVYKELQKGENVLSIDLSGYAGGIYFMRLITDSGECKYQKLLKY